MSKQGALSIDIILVPEKVRVLFTLCSNNSKALITSELTGYKMQGYLAYR